MSKSSSENFGKQMSKLLAFALIALYSMLAIVAYGINVITGLHEIFFLIIFFGISYVVAKYVPFKWQVRIGTLIMAAFIFGILLNVVKADKIWSIFGAGLYLVLSHYSLKSVGSFRELLHSLPDREPNRGHLDSTLPNASANESSLPNKSNSNQIFHKRVGSCRGNNTQIGGICHRTLLKCGNCGTAGCEIQHCTNKNFQSSKCLTCGTIAIDQ